MPVQLLRFLKLLKPAYRRKDYVRARAGQIPSIKGAAEQLALKLAELDLSALYVATDAPDAEFDLLKSYLGDFKVVKFQPSEEVLTKYKVFLVRARK